MENTIFAFYGSLRRGMENHSLHSKHLKYLFSARLRGYRLYSRGDFPVAVKSSSLADSIVVELFKIVDRSTREMIHKLEMDEGYFLENVVVNEMQANMYLVETPENYPLVENGDWVTFFRETH
ncbi:MAG: gamma-glutamylcyclotransferase [Bacteroidota bacterium]